MSTSSFFLSISFLFVFFVSVKAQETEAIRMKQFNLEDGVAMSGYDPVSYFSGKPEKGLKTFILKYKSVTYRFASQANLDKFKTDPGRYEPAYGGWCAYAMGERGEKVEVDPATFKIINGKIYLFYNAFFNNTLHDWNKDEANLKKKADQHWTSFTKP
ncbi:MAG TPA: YHS domain-containing (seleno)protein [Cytophagaceae bacterium]|nr:YHS domain-containing (seleno)protein [Cytophagaceae bacterium]